MTKKMKLSMLSILCLCIGLSTIWLVHFLHLPRVAEGNYNQLELGMSRADVEAIFGEPPSKGEKIILNGEQITSLIDFVPGADLWCGASGIAIIEFDESGRIVRKTWRRKELTLFEKTIFLYPWFQKW